MGQTPGSDSALQGFEENILAHLFYFSMAVGLCQRESVKDRLVTTTNVFYPLVAASAL
jgi:hypothetical protein